MDDRQKSDIKSKVALAATHIYGLTSKCERIFFHLFNVLFIFLYFFIILSYFILFSEAKKLSLVLLSQAKKSEYGITQSCSSIAVINVENLHGIVMSCNPFLEVCDM